jgi:hypothetical protein
VGRFNLNANNIPDAKISHLRFLGREDSKTLLIVTKTNGGGGCSSEDELHVVELDVRDEDDPRGDADFSPALAKLFVADSGKLKKEQNQDGVKQENFTAEESVSRASCTIIECVVHKNKDFRQNKDLSKTVYHKSKLFSKRRTFPTSLS